MIRVRNLCFRYGHGDFCLQVDDLSVAAGERVGWTGSSGCGKTTLLHLLAGIIRPSQGSVQTCGQELNRLSDRERRDFRVSRVGLVFQDFALLDYLSVLDNVLLPYRINRSLRVDATVRERARDLVDTVGLGDLLQRRPTELSQGERQRVAVCRALIADPAVVLADEPVANLDPDNAARVLDSLDDYARLKGATLIVVTHDHSILPRFDRHIDVSSTSSPLESEGRQVP